MTNSDLVVTNRLLSKIADLQSGAKFYRISNADGKVWLMPAKNMRVAMNLYQPSGRKGKLFKRLYPWLHRIGAVNHTMKATCINCRLHKELEELLCGLFCVDSLEFAVFCGTPCVHQKITIQISKGQNILGYCKATDNKEIASLFYGEAHTLNTLKDDEVEGIPKCLYCGEVCDDVSIFVQTTTKTRHSTVEHEWSRIHEKFLTTMRDKTLREIPFDKSDFHTAMNNLRSHTDWLPEFIDKQWLIATIDKTIAKYEGTQVAFSAYHGDFTPWNMFVDNGRLFVFDWEYARMSYPPMLDKYHFFTQTARFEKHWTAENIMEYAWSANGKWIDTGEYRLYILEAMSRFAMREKGHIEGDMIEAFEIWYDLLKFLHK